MGRLEKLEPHTGTLQASALDVLKALQPGAVFGVLGDSFMRQALDAFACDLRRDNHPQMAGFLDWERVMSATGRHREEDVPRRYRFAGPHGGAGGAGEADQMRWYWLNQMNYNKGEVQKLLAASDVVLINIGLHYCQPIRAGADARCREQFTRLETELHELFSMLSAWATCAEGVARGRVPIFQESSAQHFPRAEASQLAEPSAPSTGDWETRSFFPQLAPPNGECRCAETDDGAAPLRTQLVRNVSRRYPAVRVLPLHSLLAPRHRWHQQDCRARSEALHRPDLAGSASAKGGCDCTHYCWTPAFWRVYFRALLDAVSPIK